jgi:hypothetical protein
VSVSGALTRPRDSTGGLSSRVGRHLVLPGQSMASLAAEEQLKEDQRRPV